MVRKKLGRNRKNRCRFCTKEGCPRPAFVDYKDVQMLKKLCTSQGKLFSRKRSGTCAAFQRAVKDAIKRARFMALLPYVGAAGSLRCCRRTCAGGKRPQRGYARCRGGPILSLLEVSSMLTLRLPDGS